MAHAHLASAAVQYTNSKFVQAVDILADDVAVWDLANRLGFVVTRAVAADIGADGALNSGTPHGCRQQKQNLPSCSTVRALRANSACFCSPP